MTKRNEICPCGSGKKYKKCCMVLTPKDKWVERALQIGEVWPNNEILVNTYFGVFDYSIKKQWRGACHAVSSILYILLKEQGINCVLSLGFVKTSAFEFPFSHSWLTIDEHIFDIGLYRSNPGFNGNVLFVETSPPIFKGYNLSSNKPTDVSFGVTTDRKNKDQNFKLLSKMTIGQYMDGWKAHKNGLWGEAVEVAKSLNIELEVIDLKTKYSHERFTVSNF